MDRSIKSRTLAIGVLTAGALGAFLRIFYFRMAPDDRGLLQSGHPLGIAFWALVILAAAGVFIAARKLPEDRGAAPTGLLSGLSQILLGISCGLLGLRTEGMLFGGLLRILGLITGAALLADGICRMTGKKMGSWANSLLCIFLMFYAVSSYSIISREPEMERILVPTLGLFSLLLHSYYMAAWDLGKAPARIATGVCAMTCFFCLCTLGCPGVRLLHLAGAVSAFLTLLTPAEERQG